MFQLRGRPTHLKQFSILTFATGYHLPFPGVCSAAYTYHQIAHQPIHRYLGEWLNPSSPAQSLAPRSVSEPGPHLRNRIVLFGSAQAKVLIGQPGGQLKVQPKGTADRTSFFLNEGKGCGEKWLGVRGFKRLLAR
jgi:hypothetical protein